MLVGAGILIAQCGHYQLPGSTRIGTGHAETKSARKRGAEDVRVRRVRPRVQETIPALLMALMLMLLNWVNTTGEYILGSIVTESVAKTIAAGQGGGLSPEQLIGDFYSKYFTLREYHWSCAAVVRRVPHRQASWRVESGTDPAAAITRRLQRADLLSHVDSDYLTAKVAENSTDYSLNNTVRNMLFLPCT